MHHPGPPRFVATGAELELAPRDPDPSAAYTWDLAEAPVDSTAALGDDPVEHFVPDVPGTYVARLSAPDGEHDLTIRAFPGSLAPVYVAGTSGTSGGRSGGDTTPRATVQRSESGPGTSAGLDGEEATGEDGGGRPRVILSATVDGDDVVVRADPSSNPRSAESVTDLDVEFLIDDRDDLALRDVRVGSRELVIPIERMPGRARVYAVAVGRDGFSVPDAIELTREDDSVSTDGGVDTVSTDGGADTVSSDGGSDTVSSDGGIDATVGEGETESLANDAVATRPRIRTGRPYEPPAWAEDAVIYEIYVRTFGAYDDESAGEDAAGENTAGEDTTGVEASGEDTTGAGAASEDAVGVEAAGEDAVSADAETGDEEDRTSAFDTIVDRLDYLEDLGVDVLWLTPVLENDHAPHGYNVTDFFSIAADLGTSDDYVAFVEAARDRGIKVLFDLVCNHSARTHPYFQAAVSEPDSEYRDWYEWRTDTEPETYFDWEHIANFDFDSLHVRRHLLDAVETWAPLVDGFRCDMAWAVPDSFWREIHDLTKDLDEDFLLLDETIPYIPDFQAGLFDVHFDSTTYAALRRVGRGESPATDILDAIDERAAAGFPEYAGFMLYAENHDETRYIVECGRPAAEAALGALFTLPGAPMVYAGQEFGQRGKRDDLAWEHADDELRRFVERLAKLRRGTPALSAEAPLERVDYGVVDGDADSVVAYGRVTDRDVAVVILNFGSEAATVTVGGVTTDRVSTAERPADSTSVDEVSRERDSVGSATVESSSVEGITVESVTVVTSDGRILEE